MNSASPLSHPTYLRLFTAQVIALLGTGLATVALGLMAFDKAGGDAGKVLATALSLKMIAYVGLSPVFGFLANRLPRKTLMVALDAGRAACVGLMPFATQLWHIYVLIFMLSACSAGFTPTFQATIPSILPDDARYTRALSLSRLAYDLENLLSPTVAAFALTVLTYNGLFTLNAIAFVISGVLVVTATIPQMTGQHTQSAGPVFGFQTYFRTPRLRALMALSMAAALGGAMVIVNTVVYVQGRLALGETSTAIALAAFGGGSMLVALFLPRFLDHQPDRPFMLCGALVVAGALFSLVTLPGFAGLLPIWFLLGVGTSLIQTPSARLLKRSSHDGNRTAVFAAQFSLSHLCWLGAYLAAGWIGGVDAMADVAVLLAAGTLVSFVLALWYWRGSDESVLTHRHEEMVHAHPHRHDEHHQHHHDGSEGPEPHSHTHAHEAMEHTHEFVIDVHHSQWPMSKPE